MRDIVVGVDASAGSLRALRWAAEEARLRRVGLRVIHSCYRPAALWGTVPQDVEPELRAARELIEAMLEEAAADLVTSTVQAEVRTGRAGRQLVEASRDGSLLVIGTRGSGGFEGLLLGATAEHCARHATGTVVLVPKGAGRATTRTIVVGVNGSPASSSACVWAVREAELRSASVDVVSVFLPYRTHGPYGADFMDVASPGWRSRLRNAADRQAREAVEAVGTGREVTIRTRVEATHPAGELVRCSRSADLLVLGHRGREVLGDVVLGSVTRQVIHHSECPVAIVRASAPAEGGP